jgi:single-strand DNA-binding protein
MNSINSILVEGNLVRDPAFKTTTGGTSLCTFSIATSRYFKQGNEMAKETSYFDVESWSCLADNCRNRGHKGRGVRVVGRLKQNRWTDTEGVSRSRVVIVAENIEFRPDAKAESPVPEMPTEDEFPSF